MKLYNEPIEVDLDANERPAFIYWRQRTLAVRSIDEEWTYDGKWWTTPELKGIHRHYYRVACAGQRQATADFEIYRETGARVAEAWVLSRVLD